LIIHSYLFSAEWIFIIALFDDGFILWGEHVDFKMVLEAPIIVNWAQAALKHEY